MRMFYKLNIICVFYSFLCLLQLQFMGTPNMQHKDHGLIFRSFIYLFHLLKQRQAQEKTQFVLKASFLEIYNEKVRELFPSIFRHIFTISVGDDSALYIFWGEIHKTDRNQVNVECGELLCVLCVVWCVHEGEGARTISLNWSNEWNVKNILYASSMVILVMTIWAARGEGADESHANPSLDDEKFMSRDSSILCDSHNTEEIEWKHENYAEILLLGVVAELLIFNVIRCRMCKHTKKCR